MTAPGSILIPDLVIWGGSFRERTLKKAKILLTTGPSKKSLRPDRSFREGHLGGGMRVPSTSHSFKRPVPGVYGTEVDSHLGTKKIIHTHLHPFATKP